jgi:hypothetical protein
MKSLLEVFKKHLKENSTLKPEFQKLVQLYSHKVAEIDDPVRIADILSQMVVELEQAEGESPSDVLKGEDYQITTNFHGIREAVNSKLYDLYRRHAATLESVKDLGEMLRKLAFSIDNMNLDPGFSFEIQRAYDELLTVLEKGLQKKPQEPIVRPSKRGP